MINRHLAIAVSILGASFAIVNAGRTEQGPLRAEPSPAGMAQQEGTEALARGPIHEAFAEPVDSHPQPGRLVPKQPPAAIEELPPDQKPAGDNVQWLPGYWGWDDERNDFIWVSGIWRNEPPARQWLPGHWDQTANGWQWSPGFWGMQGQQEIAFLPPPPDPVAAAPSVPPPDNNSVFAPGTWVYVDTRYVWRPGYWLGYRPGWVWIPAHYVWTPAGFVFVDGYWDFELARRGLLFAPVYVQPAYAARPNWVYRPAFVIGTDFLLGALFLRPGHYHYYFGDYFDPDYRRRGFVSWVDFHGDRSGFDPLFSYYRWQHRDDRRWEGDLRGLYTARFNGTAPRPPRTLVQQNTLIQNITVNRNVNVTNLSTVTALTPLTQVNRAVVNLQPVSREQHLEAQKSIQRSRAVSQERARVETQTVAKGAAPTKPADQPHVAKVELPKVAVAPKASEHQPPPPPVVLGKPQVRPEPAKPPAAPPKPEAKPQPKPQPKPEGKPPATPPKAEAKPEPKPQPKAEVKPPATPPKAEGKPPPKSEPKPPTAAKIPEARPEPKPQPKTEAKPPTAALRPEVKPPPPAASAQHHAPAAKPEHGEHKT